MAELSGFTESPAEQLRELLLRLVVPQRLSMNEHRASGVPGDRWPLS